MLFPLILGTLPLSRLCSIPSRALLSNPILYTPSPVPHRSNINMAWRSSGASNRDLIENLWHNKLITHPEVKAAFLKVPSLALPSLAKPPD